MERERRGETLDRKGRGRSPHLALGSAAASMAAGAGAAAGGNEGFERFWNVRMRSEKTARSRAKENRVREGNMVKMSS